MRNLEEMDPDQEKLKLRNQKRTRNDMLIRKLFKLNFSFSANEISGNN